MVFTRRPVNYRPTLDQTIELAINERLREYERKEGSIPDALAVGMDPRALLEYVHTLETEVSNLEEQLQQSHDIRTTYQSDIEKQYKYTQELVAKHAEQLQDYIKLVNQLQKENTGLLQANEELRKHVMKLESKIQTLQNSNTDMLSKLADTSLRLTDTSLRLDRSEKDFEEFKNRIELLAEFGDWISELRIVIFDSISVTEVGSKFNCWGDFATAEAKEYRQWKKNQKKGERPLKQVLRETLDTFAITLDEWGLLDEFKWDRTALFHRKKGNTQETIQKLAKLPNDMVNMRSALKKAIDIVEKHSDC